MTMSEGSTPRAGEKICLHDILVSLRDLSRAVSGPFNSAAGFSLRGQRKIRTTHC